MNKDKDKDTLTRVVKVIRTCKQTDMPMEAGSILEELGIDSLDVLMLTGELEEEFDITIDEDSLEGVTTVADIVRRLEEALC